MDLSQAINYYRPIRRYEDGGIADTYEKRDRQTIDRLSNLQYQQWRNNLPPNLRQESPKYDLYGAYWSGVDPELSDDGYHLPSRDPNTNRILKSEDHPTFWQGIEADADYGYYPQFRGREVYTIPSFKNGMRFKMINKSNYTK